MTCGDKFKWNCPTAGTRVLPEEVGGQPRAPAPEQDLPPRHYFRHAGKVYPSLTWIQRELRHSLWHPAVRYPVLAAYIVGSEARGTARPDSDLDIAVVIAPVRGKTALQYSAAYHARQRRLPEFLGRKIDLQFFYPASLELEGYARIVIPMAQGEDG